MLTRVRIKKNIFLLALRLFLAALIFISNPAYAQGNACSSAAQEKNNISSSTLAADETRASVLSSVYFDKLVESIQFIRELDEIEAKQPEVIQDSQFLKILMRAIVRPSEELSTTDIESINSNPIKKKLYQGIMTLMGASHVSLKLTQGLLEYWNAKKSVFIIQKERSWKLKLLRLLQGTYNGLRFFATPIGYLPRWENPINKIINKVVSDPKYTLTAEEEKTLERYQSEDVVTKNRQFIVNNPKWSNFRKWTKRVFVGLLLVNSALVINWGMHLSEPQSVVAVDQFFSAPENRLKENQVRLYSETAPFPHMALEIDGKVYSYGVERMSISTSYEYLMESEIHKKIAAIVPKSEDKNTTWRDSINLTSAFHAAGLDKLPRSVQTITLNLNIEQKNRLKRYLETSEYSRYRNHTLVMDCASMISLALAKNTTEPVPLFRHTPVGVDASPASVLMYYAALKSANVKNVDGVPLVGDIKEVAIEDTKNLNVHFWRNLYINAMDGKIFLSFLNMDLPWRSYLNIRYGEDNFQYLEPAVQHELESWQTEVSRDFQNLETSDPVALQVQVFVGKANAMLSVPKVNRDGVWMQKWNDLSAAAVYFFNREIQSSTEKINSPDTAFNDLLRESYRRDILVAYLNSENSSASSVTSTPRLSSAASILAQLIKH